MRSASPLLLAELDSAVSGLVFSAPDQRFADLVSGLPRGRRPLVIVAAATAEDVAFAMSVAGRQGLPVSVLPAGRTPARRGGVLILTTLLRRVEVDPESSTARVPAGAGWAELVREARRYGLRPAPGTRGASAESLSDAEVVGYEVVTPNGRFVQVDPIGDADLFWALRGGHAQPATVTETRVRLVPFEDERWSAEDAEAVVREWSRELVLS
ncbi:FAD-binding oxidoreductase [Naasia aerilata]|uniref:FAD-binding PCMH-type domain-containing protein n=1 Tax=Naasia aerilata TaxID=1162966 RepID=A0ABN6XTY9_9MICO|nr:FAD-binding protein [Naasia aerilata]BDZ47100.1 hypothetical protein GCM10025866_30090 [Naasia aerilata]